MSKVGRDSTTDLGPGWPGLVRARRLLSMVLWISPCFWELAKGFVRDGFLQVIPHKLWWHRSIVRSQLATPSLSRPLSGILTPTMAGSSRQL